MSRTDDMKLAQWAGHELKCESDELMHNQPTMWGNLGHTTYTVVPWYTSQDYEAIALLEVAVRKGLQPKIETSDIAYFATAGGHIHVRPTFHEALTSVILRCITG
jgi:hypothetical protein